VYYNNKEGGVMYLYDLFDIKDYLELKNEGYVREQTHPYHDLSILNYTEKAQYDNLWNDVTSQCRGLIVNSHDKVIARPYDKFHNYSDEDNQYLDSPATITDKMDGSLGIYWEYKADWGIATRGSFTSDQAIHATYLLKSRYKKFIEGTGIDLTYMFEIIYPENRIVLNYGFDDLVLLGARDIEEGYTVPPKSLPEWLGPRTTTFPYKTLREALEAPQRVNAEGYVVSFSHNEHRIKIKQADYVALHKIVTGLTKRRVWENMKSGQSIEKMCEIIPDEWHEWLQETYFSIYENFTITLSNIEHDYWLVNLDMWNSFKYPDGWTRKDFAIRVKDTQYPGLMFMLLDGKNITSKVYDLVRPEAE
jgi:RNA ligase